MLSILFHKHSASVSTRNLNEICARGVSFTHDAFQYHFNRQKRKGYIIWHKTSGFFMFLCVKRFTTIQFIWAHGDDTSFRNIQLFLSLHLHRRMRLAKILHVSFKMFIFELVRLMHIELEMCYIAAACLYFCYFTIDYVFTVWISTEG